MSDPIGQVAQVSFIIASSESFFLEHNIWEKNSPSLLAGKLLHDSINVNSDVSVYECQGKR